MEYLLLALAAIGNSIMGLIAIMRSQRSISTRYFALSAFSVGIWALGDIFLLFGRDADAVRFGEALFYIGPVVAALFLALFSSSFPHNTMPGSLRKTFLSLPVIIVSLIIILYDEFIIQSIKIVESGPNQVTIAWSGFLVYAVFFSVYFLLSYYNLYRNLKVARGRYKNQLAYSLVGIFLTSVLASISNLILPLLSINYFIWLGPLFTVFYVVATTIAIVKHGLFDMRLAVVRAITYSLVLITLATVYYFSAYAISQAILTAGSPSLLSVTPLNVALALLLAFIFQPVKIFFDKLTNRVFYRDNYSFDDFFARLSRELSTTTDLRNLLLRASNEISDTLKSEYAFFFMRYGEGKHITVGTPHRGTMLAADIATLDELLVDKKSVILTDVLDEADPLYELLNRHAIAMTLPLEHDDAIIGYLFLGYQRGRDYTKRDMRALEAVSDELVIAVQNALSVQEVREINETLQERIKEATKELRATNEQLQRLDEAKDEFVSMASHQLRTPLTSVKGYISMVLEGDAGTISPQQRQLLEEAFTSSERMVHLISDFLNVSRLQTGKFIIEAHKIDLAKVVAQEVDSLQTTAHAHNLKLQFRRPSRFPILFLDEGKIRQVLMNFIDNAIYYSREHTTITVELTVEEGDAVLKVHDTGIGVPKTEQKHLFTKFFRATNARKQRPDGTGVGLFLAKKVIVAHGGGMVFESQEDEGSTFGFRLPIKKLDTAPAQDTNKLEKQPDDH